MTYSDTVEFPIRALQLLNVVPLGSLKPLLRFLSDDNKARRAWCLAFHPGLAVHLATHAQVSGSSAAMALDLLDAGASIPAVAKAANYKEHEAHLKSPSHEKAVSITPSCGVA